MAERLTFEVGEVAVYVRHGEHYGKECTVISTLYSGAVFQYANGPIEEGDAYMIDAPWLPRTPGVRWCAQVQHLKKRPPKQDWNKMCNLNEVPQHAAV